MRGNLLPPLDPSLNEQTLILPYTSDPNRIGRFNAFNPANHTRHDNEYYIEWLKGSYCDIQQTKPFLINTRRYEETETGEQTLILRDSSEPDGILVETWNTAS